MTNSKSTFLKRRPKHTSNLGDKQEFQKFQKFQKLYFEWKASGLSRHKFCQEKGLVLSVFLQWCQKFSLEVLPKESEESILCEIKLPNGMVFSTSFELLSLPSFLRKLSYTIERNNQPRDLTKSVKMK